MNLSSIWPKKTKNDVVTAVAEACQSLQKIASNKENSMLYTQFWLAVHHVSLSRVLATAAQTLKIASHRAKDTNDLLYKIAARASLRGIDGADKIYAYLEWKASSLNPDIFQERDPAS